MKERKIKRGYDRFMDGCSDKKLGMYWLNNEKLDMPSYRKVRIWKRLQVGVTLHLVINIRYS